MSLRDIALGQYVHGDSFIHRLDPRTKLICILIVTGALFATGGTMHFIVITLVIITAAAASGIGISSYARSLRPFAFLIAVTVLLNILFTGGHIIMEAPLPYGGVTREGLYAGLLYGGRIVLLITAASVMMHTTEPIVLVDGIEKLLRPLGRLGLNPRSAAMAMMLTIRFIPILHDEAVKIRKSIATRGLGREKGLRARITGTTHMFMPLFHAAIRKADTLAVAMDCRLFADARGRTRFREPVIAVRDWTVLVITAIGGAALVFL